MKKKNWFSILATTLVISIVITTFAGCNTAGTDAQGSPLYVVLTGDLYTQGGKSTSLTFSTTATPSDGSYSGTITIGNGSSDGNFTITGSANDFSMNGSTKFCAYWYSDSQYCSNRSWKSGLNFGLHAQASGITGSSPSSRDSLVWNISKTVDSKGNMTLNGSILSNSGSIPVEMTAATDGTLAGRITIEGTTIVMNGFIDSASVSVVPADSAAILLIVSALHTQIVN